MGLKALKKAEFVNGKQLGHPDDTFSDSLIGSEFTVSIATENVKITINAADAEYYARGLQMLNALIKPMKNKRRRK